MSVSRVDTPACENIMPKALVIHYSFSGQTRGLSQRLAAGMADAGVTVHRDRIQPCIRHRFPIGSIPATIHKMLVTLVRQRIAIEPPPPAWRDEWDCVVLGGPTWSYNPSGPVLSLIDQYGEQLFARRMVVPLISCRGYWRVHWHGLRRLLVAVGAEVPTCIVFSHPVAEPWRTLGVFLKLAGRVPERSFGGRYPHYGHSRRQLEEAYRFGVLLGRALVDGAPLADLDFRTPIALP